VTKKGRLRWFGYAEDKSDSSDFYAERRPSMPDVKW